jgi:serine/threonine-protein kinase RsbW
MGPTRNTVRLAFPSAFEMIDLVQLVTDRVGRLMSFDEDTRHWVGVAVRESVINAIKHGNRHDPQKVVVVEFDLGPTDPPEELTVSVCDQGEGFDPDALPDPLAPENLLKSSGRGIFFMRSFMDGVVLSKCPGGGMQVRMVKRVGRSA